jgi:hypothetical protein
MAGLPPEYVVRLGEYSVRLVETDDDLRAVRDLKVLELGEEQTASLAQFRDWWRRYPFGIYGLFFQGELIGDFDIWPMADELAIGFIDGKLGYNDLIPQPMAQLIANPVHYWRIAGLFLRQDFRGQHKNNPIGLLLGHALNRWADSVGVTYPMTIFTTAFRIESQNMLQRFGFAQIKAASEMLNGKPLYSRSADSKNELFAALVERGLPNL